MAKKYKIYMSHSWAYSDSYERFVETIEDAFDFKLYSVPKNSPLHKDPGGKALYEAVKRQISACDVVLILAGVYPTYDKWVDMEVEIASEAFDVPKPIMIVEAWGPESISKFEKNSANMIVTWNSETIATGLRQLLN